MARPEEKAKSMLNRWIQQGKGDEGGSGLRRKRRPRMASECKDLNECDKWRSQILREIGGKVMDIQNSTLPQATIRELNDEINKLMKIKYAWEKQIMALGGPNYTTRAPKGADGDGQGGKRPEPTRVPHLPTGAKVDSSLSTPHSNPTRLDSRPVERTALTPARPSRCRGPGLFVQVFRRGEEPV